ncbi:hypothetical protein [Nocardia blacklockiae]|uniref:hypothetical protein n=1 Tax=Nocardia blacklockiae TaxID=480036 RepID=UPI001895A3EB|nr:hypothetical protein [Nocardia blacklockiae]MBF6175792.1 hypothetical protein [Nocardia blacklockiae]
MTTTPPSAPTLWTRIRLALIGFLRAHTRWIIATALAVLLAFAGMVGLINFGMDLKDDRNPSPPASSASPPPTNAPTVVSQHTGKTIKDVEGIDLDTGEVKNQDLPGVDASPSRTADRLNAMTDAASRFAIPGQGTGGTYDRCLAVPDVVWSHPLYNLYALKTRDTICVRTDRRNIAAMTVTHVPSAGEPYLAFDYTTWAGR